MVSKDPMDSLHRGTGERYPETHRERSRVLGACACVIMPCRAGMGQGYSEPPSHALDRLLRSTPHLAALGAIVIAVTILCLFSCPLTQARRGVVRVRQRRVRGSTATLTCQRTVGVRCRKGRGRAAARLGRQLALGRCGCCRRRAQIGSFLP